MTKPVIPPRNKVPPPGASAQQPPKPVLPEKKVADKKEPRPSAPPVVQPTPAERKPCEDAKIDDWISVSKSAVRKGAISIGLGVGQADEKMPLCVSMDDLCKHCLLIGATGYGKTVLMSQMTVQAIMSGANVFVIAPHADLIYERILPFLPLGYADHIVIIDPSDMELPVAINLLEIPEREKLEREGKTAQLEKMKDTLIGNMFNMFKRIWSTPGAWGPLLEKNLTYLLQAVLSIPDTTLIDAHWVLTNWEKRARLINMLEKEELRTFFTHEINQMRYEDTSSVRNRLGKFALSETLRAALCCRNNPIRMMDLVQPGKVVLIDLDQKKLGIETMRIMGLIFLTQIWMSVIAKKGYDVVTDEKKADWRTFVFSDEFQNFAVGGFQDMLSEARKYNMSFMMATQYLQQVDKEMRDGIIANVATPICMGVGADDALTMSRVLEVNHEFLTSLDPFQFFVRTVVGSRKTGPMWGMTYPPLEPPANWREKVIEFKKISRQNYGRPYDPAGTSLFGGDVQDMMDLLLAMYGLSIDGGRDSFSGREIHGRLEEMSHLPGLISDYDMKHLIESANASGKIEIDPSKAAEIAPPRNKEEEEKKWMKTHYRITIDGSIYMGLRTDVGTSAASGGDTHKHLLLRMMRFMAERGVKMRITKQGGSDVKPDADIFTTPNLTGRRAADIRRIQENLRDTWLYQQSRGLDVNIEAESSTLAAPDKIYKNLSKGMVMDRIVFFCVATTEDAHKLCDILREFVEEKHKGYIIDPTKAYREGALPRKPTHQDYRIFIVNEGEELKQMDGTTAKISVVEKVATMEITEGPIGFWKSLVPVLEEAMKAAGGERATVTLLNIHEEIKKTQPNTSMVSVLEWIRKQTDMVPPQVVKEIQDTICIITKHSIEKIRASLRQTETDTAENRRTQAAELALIAKATQHLRKRLESVGEESFPDTGDLARKLNTNKWIIAKMLRMMCVEPDPADGVITIRSMDILADDELKPGKDAETPQEMPQKPPETPQKPTATPPVPQDVERPKQPAAGTQETSEEKAPVTPSAPQPRQPKEAPAPPGPKPAPAKGKKMSKKEVAAPQPASLKPVSERLTEHFMTHPEPQQLSQISEALGLDIDDFKTQLFRLVKRGMLIPAGRATYCSKAYKNKIEKIDSAP